MEPIAISGELSGIYMYSIDYGIDDYVTVAFAHGKDQKLHRRRIYYNTSEPYIVLCGRRIKLSTFIRTQQ